MNDIFLMRMKEYLQDEFGAFFDTLDLPLYRGLCVNTLKTDVSIVEENLPYLLQKSPFCKEGFYLNNDSVGIGNHPLHMGGAFYIQEPSASSAVTILDVQEHDIVLDLCAAPGGKSGQIARRLNHTGFLVCNEYDPKRARILLSNMERLGVGEAAITNADSSAIARHCYEFFDRILVDAPCSGEGMIKKHDKASEQWSISNIKMCAKRQIEILRNAYYALKPGGTLVYSTCTYAKEENEEIVAQFIKEFHDIEQVDCNVTFGRKGFECEGMDHTKVCRIFPMDGGEGHFVAKFYKKKSKQNYKLPLHKKEEIAKEYLQQIQQVLTLPPGYFYKHENQIYFKKNPFVKLNGIHVLRQGILLGELKKQHFEPHNHLFLSAYLKGFIRQIVNLDWEQWEIFQSGNVVLIPNIKGYVALAYENMIVGYGKGDGVVIKNKYPKGLRRKKI